MKIPQESKEWRKMGDGIWERTVKRKDPGCKEGFCFVHYIYHEIVCRYCGILAIAAKTDIDIGNGRFCSFSCGAQARNMKGANHPRWKGRRIDSQGYVQLKKPDHPNADKQGYLREHVFVMSEELGRPLQNGEIVHHENENKQDNDLSNLKLMANNTEHLALHRRMEKDGEWVKR